MKCIESVPFVGWWLEEKRTWLLRGGRWMLTAGKWILVEKAVAGVFAYLILGELIKAFGTVNGALCYFALFFSCSALFLWWYDTRKLDLFGIATIKAKFHARFPWTMHTPLVIKIPWMCLAFVLAAWQLAPPLMLLCFRREDRKPIPWMDYPLLLLCTAGATVLWTGIELGLMARIKAAVWSALFG